MAQTANRSTSVLGSTIIPKLGIEFDEATLSAAILDFVQKLGYDSCTEDQKSAVMKHLCGQDVFVSLPTESGKCVMPAFPTCITTFVGR